MTSNLRKGGLSHFLINALDIAADGAIILEELTYSAQMRAIKGIPSKNHKHALKEAVRRLKNKGIVEHERIAEGRILVKLTGFGRSLLEDKAEEKWDGKYRIVVWDIPESKKRIRNLLRRQMKNSGFKVWQKSVWVSKKNITLKIKDLIKELGLEKWVAIIESEDSSLHTLFNDRT